MEGKEKGGERTAVCSKAEQWIDGDGVCYMLIRDVGLSRLKKETVPN